jgi:hypothetical protein
MPGHSSVQESAAALSAYLGRGLGPGFHPQDRVRHLLKGAGHAEGMCLRSGRIRRGMIDPYGVAPRTTTLPSVRGNIAPPGATGHTSPGGKGVTNS